MEQPKYTLKDTTPEEDKQFMADFQELLDKGSFYFEPVPQFSRKTLESPWEITTQIMLKKKVLIAEKLDEDKSKA